MNGRQGSEPGGVLGIYSGGIARIPHLGALMPEFDRIALRPKDAAQCSAIAGWGMKTTARRAM